MSEMTKALGFAPEGLWVTTLTLTLSQRERGLTRVQLP